MNQGLARLLEARLRRALRPSLLDHRPSRTGQGSSQSLRPDALAAGVAAARAAAGADGPALTILAAQIQAGCYHVPSERIAKALLHELKQR